MTQYFPIIVVSPEAREDARVEPMGTKRKFWYRTPDGGRWLFKFNRPAHGEDWAEKIACEIAELLGLPHAVADLASCENQSGVAVRDFVPEGFRLVHGNELLVELVDPAYPRDQNFKVRQHNLPNVFHVLQTASVALPSAIHLPAGVNSAAGLLAGYLLLDALISNTDRHHENWAILERRAAKDQPRVAELAPTFDHASSLGRNEPDEKRQLRLDGRDTQYTVSTYLAKAPSRIYASDADERPLSPLDAFAGASRVVPAAARAWLAALDYCSTDSVREIVARVPDERMSAVARRFVLRMVELSRQELLRLCP